MLHLTPARVAKLVRRRRLKISRLQGRAGSIPALGTKKNKLTSVGLFLLWND